MCHCASKSCFSLYGFCSAALCTLGSCQDDKGKTDEAENLLRESLDMFPAACPDDKATIAIGESFSCLIVTIVYSEFQLYY